MPAGLGDQLGAAVGQAAGADVVDAEDRVVLAQRDAGVDDFLAASLHLRVAALDGVEVQVGRIAARGHRGGRPAPEPDAHGRPAQLDDRRARRDRPLLRMDALDVAHAAGGHDRLVVAAVTPGHGVLEGAEQAGQLRAAELVAEGGPADGPLEHDLQRRGQPRREAGVGLFPRQGQAGDPQVADHERGQAGLALAAGSGGALVTDLAAHAGGGAGEGRDRGRVVVGFDLDHDVGLPGGEAVHAAGVAVDLEPRVGKALGHGRVVAIGHQRAAGMALVRVADHREQRALLRLAVDDPVGVEDLVPAVLGVDLAEHDQLHVGRVAPDRAVGGQQVLHLLVAQRQAHAHVGGPQRLQAAAEDLHSDHGRRRRVREEVGHVGVHALGHAVVQQVQRRAALFRGERPPAAVAEGVVDAALHAP
jgi:hypothetical protein